MGIYNQGVIEGIDEIILSKRKRISLSVQPGGRTVLRAPLRSSERSLRAFVDEHQDWILRAKARMAKLPQPRTAYRYQDGEMILYLGMEYPLRLVEKQQGGFAFVEGVGFCLERKRAADGARLLEAFLRRETRRLAEAYLKHYSSLHGFSYSSVRINQAMGRWGSCSGRKSLNFSYRLAMTPLACLEYVVVHELCHTRHHNHSADFWGSVEAVLPSYRQARAWLKKHGQSLPPLR